MLKKFSVLALAGMLCLPAAASAGGGAGDLANKIDDLTRQLEQLKRQMAEMKEANEAIEEKAESWDEAARFHWSGDFRARVDYFNSETLGTTASATGAPIESENETMLTNRLRINMRVKATENVEFKGRLAMYKAWGMQNNPLFSAGSGPYVQDGATTRQPQDSVLRVDRAFANWNNIANRPIWFSIGRRPTTDGPPNHLKLNNDSRMSTPSGYMDWPFDGLTLGYAYNDLFGLKADWPGRIRFCFGRGFEDGLQPENNDRLDDTDFAGISWDVYKKGDRFVYLQSFAVLNAFDYPTDWYESLSVTAGNLKADMPGAGLGSRDNIGNIYHTSFVYMDKRENFNYFVHAGWSQSDPDAEGMFNDLSLGAAGINTNSEDGYAFHLGVRYDFPNAPFKVGLEYNYGSEYWVGMSPGHDDLYNAKLSTRGNVWEVYGIWNLPAGEAISRFGKVFTRLGYQHYEFDYYGSGDWNLKPYDFDSAADKATMGALGIDPTESADQIYLTFEAYF